MQKIKSIAWSLLLLAPLLLLVLFLTPFLAPRKPRRSG